MGTFNGQVSERSGTRMRGRVREATLPMLAVPDTAAYTEYRTPDGRRVFIAEGVIDALVRLEQEHHPNETAGLLFGRHFTDGRNLCALVTDLIPPGPGEVEGTVSTVTITAHGTRQMRARAQRLVPCADPSGWAHTHGKFPPFFSHVDRAEQSLWTQPTSVGIVLTGIRGASELYQVYVGPESTLAAPVSRPVPRRAVSLQPVAAHDGVIPSRQRTTPSRPAARRLGLAWRAVAAAAVAAALAVAAASLREASVARQSAQHAEAQASAASQAAIRAGKGTESGQAMAGRALTEARRASRNAHQAEMTVRTQLPRLRSRASAAENAAGAASTAAQHALQQSSENALAITALQSKLAVLERAAFAPAPATTKPAAHAAAKGHVAKQHVPTSSARVTGRKGPR